MFEPQSNAVFAQLPHAGRASAARAGWKFYQFIGAGGCRLMCAWDTKPETVEQFTDEIRTLCAALKPMTRPLPTTRADYPHFLSIPTRWSDNDVYGHVNNVVYYSYFDTVVNEYLIRAPACSISSMARRSGSSSRRIATTSRRWCFPSAIEAGLRVTRLGTTSVRYEVGDLQRGRRASRRARTFRARVRRSRDAPSGAVARRAARGARTAERTP